MFGFCTIQIGLKGEQSDQACRCCASVSLKNTKWTVVLDAPKSQCLLLDPASLFRYDDTNSLLGWILDEKMDTGSDFIGRCYWSGVE